MTIGSTARAVLDKKLRSGCMRFSSHWACLFVSEVLMVLWCKLNRHMLQDRLDLLSLVQTTRTLLESGVMEDNVFMFVYESILFLIIRLSLFFTLK